MTQRLSLLKLYNLPCYASRRPSLENSRIQITETEDAKFYNYFASLKIFFFAEVFAPIKNYLWFLEQETEIAYLHWATLQNTTT